ncbi:MULTISPECIES: hypothetical protein [unclassified Streptomyces]|uniref:hypothetical protein n=1 Tax=unclassified Streptomyces TaxID=2593676 RepID=UPI001BE6B10F|nr:MULTISPECIES: hypothetical protein [unclassified Streptomyces]MBT2405472.1 hypothetical protein [Streptomyces sp. ISL-21]MBT2612446.1 hypothetical protein [Streptomyces sp. ISL-87]
MLLARQALRGFRFAGVVFLAAVFFAAVFFAGAFRAGRSWTVADSPRETLASWTEGR